MSERRKKDWRELCAAVSNERDSNKLNLLIQELIAVLDEHHGRAVYAVPENNNPEAASSSG